MNQPWICPRCATVNAPHVNQCTCVPPAPPPNMYVPPYDPNGTALPWQPPTIKKYWVGDPPWGTGTAVYPTDPYISITLSDRTTDRTIFQGGYDLQIGGN